MKNVKKSKTIAFLKKTLSCFMCFVIALSVFSLTAVAEDGKTAKSSIGTSAYDKIDMDDVTGEGQNPDEITGAASSAAKKKEWYEYLTYSANPVGMYPVDDTTRILFFDPYDYTNSLIMEVDDSLTEWSSANEITISYTTGTSISENFSSNTSTDTSVQVAKGEDVSYGLSEGYSTTQTKDWSTSWDESISVSEEYSASKSTSKTTQATLSSEINSSITNSISVGTQVSAGIELKKKSPVGEATGSAGVSTSSEIGFSATIGSSFGSSLSTSSTTSSEVSQSNAITKGYSMSESSGESIACGESFTADKSWTNVADRVTSSTGKSSSTGTSWSTDDSMTISISYNATYFNSLGSPLQWKVIKYSVYLPMYYIVQNKVGDEWINVSESYCLLRTIQGSCRSWIENNVVYYEHWGTGEAVTQNDFWDGFFTKDQLAEAYKNKLYPDN